jgi:hypothetical protein
MYTQIWNKYLPLIHLLMKRAVTGDQLLDMNATDFERAGPSRRPGFKFTILFRKGRLETIVNSLPLARDLAAILLPDQRVQQLMQLHDYEFQLTAKFQLAIRLLDRPQAQSAAS